MKRDEFAYQFDAIRFWDKFGGKWIVGDDFIIELEAPKDFRPMQSLKHRTVVQSLQISVAC